jgi:O-antigen ligase
MRRFILETMPPYLACGLLFVAATIGVFSGSLWAAVAIGGGVLLYAAQTARAHALYAQPRWLWGVAGAALLLFAAEVPRAVDAALAQHVWIKLTSIFVPLLLLLALKPQPGIDADRLFLRLACALGLSGLLLAAELASGGVLLHMLKPDAPLNTQYNRGIAHATVLLFPIMGGLWVTGRRRAALALAFLLLVPASLTDSRTTKMALMLGYGVTALAALWPVAVRAVLSLGALLALGFPFYAQAAFTHAFDWVQKLPPSWLHRVEIWDFLSYRIAERPWFGWGLGSTKLLDFTQPHGELYRYALAHASHAHNFVTQIWVETGVPGLVVILALMLLSLRAAARLPRPLQAFALGAWTAAFGISLCGFDFWTDALWGAFALTAFALTLAHQAFKGRQNAADA